MLSSTSFQVQSARDCAGAPVGTVLAVVGLHERMKTTGRCEGILHTIRHRTPAVGKLAQGRLHATFPEVFKRAAALEPGEFFPLDPHEVRDLRLWKADGDCRRRRLEVNAELPFTGHRCG